MPECIDKRKRRELCADNVHRQNFQKPRRNEANLMKLTFLENKGTLLQIEG